jgi:hypothetical protein
MKVGQYHVHPIRLNLSRPTNDICDSDTYLAETILVGPVEPGTGKIRANTFLATTSMLAGTKGCLLLNLTSKTLI